MLEMALSDIQTVKWVTYKNNTGVAYVSNLFNLVFEV